MNGLGKIIDYSLTHFKGIIEVVASVAVALLVDAHRYGEAAGLFTLIILMAIDDVKTK